MIKLKKIITAVTLFLMCFVLSSANAATYILHYDGQQHEYTGSSYKLMIDGVYIKTSVEPLIFNDYALVPIRDVFEAVGATVKYVDLKREIYINYEGTYVKLTIGSNDAYINSKALQIPGGITPMLISIDGSDAKTMVPLRFVSENLGFTVDFNGDKGLISISTAPVVKTSTINNFKLYPYKNLTTTIKIYSDIPIASMTAPKMTSANVLYVDIENCKYSLPNTNDISTGAVKSLRFGLSGGRTRIALDLDNMKDYDVDLSDDKMTITISVTANPSKDDEQQVDTPPAETEKIVIIDAGHGGSDPGAIGVTEDETTYQEKAITLSVATMVKNILTKQGINVIMTRDKDTYPSLTERSDLANTNSAVIFASIHANSATTPTASGFEVYYSSMNNSSATGLSSSELAKAVSNAIDKEISTKNRGVKTADHVVTKTCKMPAILVEIGFMSNPEELELLVSKDFRASLAKGIANGILSVYDKASPPIITEETTKNSNETEATTLIEKETP